MIAGGAEEPLAAIRAIRELVARRSSSASAARWAAWCSTAPIPDRDRGRHQGAGLSGRGLQRARRRRRLHVGLPARLSARRADRDLLRLCQCLRRLRGVAPALLGRISDLRRAAALPRPSAPRPEQVRHDEALNHLHWATTRDALTPPHVHPDTHHGLRHRPPHAARGRWPTRRARRASASATSKRLAVEAAVAGRGRARPGFGMLIDGTYGREALFRAADHPLWIGRPVEQPGSRPLDFEGGGSLGAKLVEWPLEPDHQVPLLHASRRCAGAARPAGARTAAPAGRGPQDRPRAAGRDHRRQARRARRRHGGERDRRGSTASGIRPDWWKLEIQPSAAAWAAVADAIARARPAAAAASCCSGSTRRPRQLVEAFRLAAACPAVKGFAVGRTIFGEPARAWLGGRIDDAEVVIGWPDGSARWSRPGTRSGRRPVMVPRPNRISPRPAGWAKSTPRPHRSDPPARLPRASKDQEGPTS